MSMRRKMTAAAATLTLTTAGLGLGLGSGSDAVAGEVDDRIDVVGLGDSYASGEGAGEYHPEFDADVNRDEKCHKSELAWIRHAIMPNGLPAAQNRFKHAACSGALARELTANDGNGEGRGAGQLNTLTEDTDVVLFSLGGNDAYFSGVLGRCAHVQVDCRFSDLKDDKGDTLLRAPLHESLPEHIRTTVRGDLTTTLREMHRRAPNARFVWLSYPDLLKGLSPTCGSFPTQARFDFANWNHILKGTQDDVANDLRGEGMDVEVRDTRQEFGLHGACNGFSSWVNNLVPDDEGVGGSESFHPNDKGQEAYARVARVDPR